MKVFVNPVVAALPQHAHLFPEFGCFDKREEGKLYHRECGTGGRGKLETPWSKEMYPLKLTPEMDEEWERLVKQHLSTAAPEEGGTEATPDSKTGP